MKKTKTPHKTQKTQPKEYKISNCQLEGGQILHEVCQGCDSAPLPLSVTPLHRGTSLNEYPDGHETLCAQQHGGFDQ